MQRHETMAVEREQNSSVRVQAVQQDADGAEEPKETPSAKCKLVTPMTVQSGQVSGVTKEVDSADSAGNHLTGKCKVVTAK